MVGLGEYIRGKRKEKGLSARELTRRSGVSQPYLSQLETGKNTKPSHEVLQKIGGTLGVSYYEMLVHAGYVEKGFTKVHQGAISDANEEERNKAITYISEKYPILDNIINSGVPIFYNRKELSPSDLKAVGAFLDVLTKDHDETYPSDEDIKKEMNWYLENTRINSNNENK